MGIPSPGVIVTPTWGIRLELLGTPQKPALFVLMEYTGSSSALSFCM